MSANLVSCRIIVRSLLCPIISQTVPSRNTVVLRRRVPLKIMHPNTDFINKRRHLDPIYEEYVVDRVDNHVKYPPIELILTKYVEDVGKPGQIVTIQPILAYDMVVLGQALYATPENIKRVKLLSDSEIEKYSSLTAYKTMKMMKLLTLSVYVNMHEPWTIEPWVIRANYRLKGIHILSDDCIEVPETPISGPNMDWEGKDFACYININKSERFPIRCRLRHYTKIFNERIILPPDHEFVPADPILLEQADILKSIPLPVWKGSE